MNVLILHANCGDYSLRRRFQSLEVIPSWFPHHAAQFSHYATFPLLNILPKREKKRDIILLRLSIIKKQRII